MAKDAQFKSHAECDGSEASVISTQTCYIEMSTLTSSEFSLELSDLVVV